MTNISTIGIIGCGAWGTGLAQAMRMANKQVLMFGRNRAVVDEINSKHTNSTYLPDITIDAGVKAHTDFAKLSSCDAVLLVTPAQHLRQTLEQAKHSIHAKAPLVICVKGIESHSGKLMHEVVKECMPGNAIAVLSGPTFAAEVACNLPAAVTIAAEKLDRAKMLCEQLGSRTFRPYASEDVLGVEMAGALKNVIAIGCGIVIGKMLGENARAALMTRGLREVTRLATSMGGKAETLMGLAGLGDLVLTCGSAQSRNMSLGIALGQGGKLADILKGRVSVAEGVTTSLAAQALAKKRGIETPIIDAVCAILHQGANINDVLTQLLSRPLTTE